ncbi:hydroxyisourate hydrolase [Variovorax sp. J22P240]|uniref:hydroxyisourate hydrolase n=1 Tax=unclassified Variovorax TaxID=663243 RepID=UPI002577FAE6|nr:MULTISPECIES: hydroxyisourate hydrolase [unclassified Variovorax]MDM0002858.1 hydroxyisourate hydrolase [Variovorax sp. J22P240]MDM0048751.1 hydroxyisourate hydrolase [Variovorax sp. J22R115]
MASPTLTRRAFLPAGLALGSLAAGTAAAQNAPAGLTTAPVSQINLSPRLTMHAIDTHNGSPGAGMKVQLSMHDGNDYRVLRRFETNRGGRTDEPLLVDQSYQPGRYELLLQVEDYFAARGTALPKPNFLAQVPVRFLIANPAERIHLAILFTPWGYSYYRGS